MKHLKVKIDKLEFNGEIVLKDIDFTINKSDRISIVWSNWSWKTTLLKTIIWEISNFDWNIENIWNLTLGYLHQIYSDNEEKSVYEELKDWFKQIKNLEKELANLEREMATNCDEKIIEKFSETLELFNNIGWYEYSNKIHQVANWMWIFHLLTRKLVEVSWWERTKIALAKILLESPDILFLDEPTNFIDMNSVEWLESYLKNKWSGWFVIISHDREFLDKTCNKTFEVQYGRWITFYHTNYSKYVIEREKIEKIKMDDFIRQDEYIKKQETLIDRFRAWSRAWWAKSREKMIDKMEKLEKPFIPRKPKFLFNYSKESPEKLISFKEAFIWRKEPLFFISEAILHKWQRIWIVWENWVWKSTMLKTIIWKVDLLDWYMSKWKWTDFLYYSQMHEELDKKLTVRDNFKLHGIDYPDEHLIWIMRHYLFEREDLDKKVWELSWWQTSKLLFAIIGQKECNLLILDEPTNHLDYDTRESLEESLKNFGWTILFISHDRYFVNKLASNIWFIDKGELSISYGNYADYKYKLENWIWMDICVFDEEAQLNLVLEEKLGEAGARKIKNKFKDGKKRKN